MQVCTRCRVSKNRNSEPTLDARRLGSEILLVHIAIRADDERHDAARLEHRRPGDQREAAGHAARLDVALGAAIPVRTLRLEDAEIIAFVRDRFAADQFAGIARILRRIDQRPQRAFGLALGHRPVQPVATARAC